MNQMKTCCLHCSSAPLRQKHAFFSKVENRRLHLKNMHTHSTLKPILWSNNNLLQQTSISCSLPLSSPPLSMPSPSFLLFTSFLMSYLSSSSSSSYCFFLFPFTCNNNSSTSSEECSYTHYVKTSLVLDQWTTVNCVPQQWAQQMIHILPTVHQTAVITPPPFFYLCAYKTGSDKEPTEFFLESKNHHLHECKLNKLIFLYKDWTDI